MFEKLSNSIMYYLNQMSLLNIKLLYKYISGKFMPCMHQVIVIFFNTFFKKSILYYKCSNLLILYDYNMSIS